MNSKSILIFILLLVLNNCQHEFQSILNNKKLQTFVKCMKEKIESSDIQNIPMEMVQSLMVNSQKINYQQLQELFTKYYDKIKDCFAPGNLPKLPDGTTIVDLNTIFKDKYDWEDFIICLMEKINNLDDSPFKKLIDLINEEKYYDALREEFKLRNNGNVILKECMPTKILSLLNKKTNDE